MLRPARYKAAAPTPPHSVWRTPTAWWALGAERSTAPSRPVTSCHAHAAPRPAHNALTATATVNSTHHQSLPSSLLDSLNHQRADNRSKKNYNPAACGPKTTVTERQRR